MNDADLDALISSTPAAPAHDDLDALIAQTPAAKPQVGAGEAFVNKAVGMIPFGKQLANLGSSAALALEGGTGVKLGPAAKAAGMQLDEGPGFGEVYRQQRQRFAEHTKAGEEQHPIASKLGSATGLAASLLAPIPGVSVGSGMGGRLASSALTGAAYGAAGGLGEADLTNPLQAGQYALKGALLGGGVGAGAGLASEGVRAVAPVLKRALDARAVASGRRVLTNGYGTMALKKPVSEEAVLEALDSGAIRPLGTTKGALNRLQGLAEDQGNTYGQLINELEGQGVQGPRIAFTAAELRHAAKEAAMQDISSDIPSFYEKVSDRLADLGQPGDRLPLTQAEAIKRNLQTQAANEYSRVGGDTLMGAAKKDVASRMRQAIEDSVEEAAQMAPQGSKVQELAGQFVPVKQRLGNLLEARNAAEKGVSRGVHRQSLGLDDKLLLAGGIASGNPHALAEGAKLMLVHKLLRARGGSTLASAARALSRGLDTPEAILPLADRAAGVMAADPALMEHRLFPALADDDADTRARIAALRRSAP